MESQKIGFPLQRALPEKAVAFFKFFFLKMSRDYSVKADCRPWSCKDLGACFILLTRVSTEESLMGSSVA